METAPDSTTVEVVYALQERQWIVSVDFSKGLTARQAVERSGLLDAHPEIAEPLVLGLFGVQVDGGHELMPGDRVEICRPLKQDPREMRHALLQIGRVMGESDD